MSLGYENAPITLLLTVLTVIESLALGSSEFVSFDLKGLYRWELWRIFSSQCIFSNMAQTLIGMLILYICRQFERQLGSRKYGSFVFLSFCVALLVQFLVVLITNALDLDFIPAHGPFFLIFSLLPLFYACIPRLQASEFSLFGLGFSEKSWTYLLGAQLCFSQGLRSLLPSSIGLLFGYLYLHNVLYMQGFRLPKVVETCFSSVGKFFLSIIPSVTGGGGAGGTARRQTPNRQPLRDDWGDAGEDYGSYDNITPTRAPTEQEIESVTALGFDRVTAINALRNTNNNVEAAVNMLLR